MSEKPVHPVDAMKAFGVSMTAEQEAEMRAYCDEEVCSSCGCDAGEDHADSCRFRLVAE